MTYAAPLSDIRFTLDDLGLLQRVAGLPGCEEVSTDLVDAILEEAGKLAGEVIAPLNATGDAQGASVENGVVRTADGFADAYRAFTDGGWAGIPFDPDYGGQGLPWLVTVAAMEMFAAANTAWTLCPTLTLGAVELLTTHGTKTQKDTFLPKLVSGEWTGTMNLTEPQAGSDLGALRSKAEPEGDHYRITGQKIFITYGEHDMTDNIVHMVLARTPDAPKGPKGISLFIVPKFLVNSNGTLGQRNDVRCVSLEHKLGIHASPTCVMAFGENDGAIGYLVGKENEGLHCMFTMMNNARMNIGISGLAIAERAYQQARDYARDRVQFGPIIQHPDVRRMLMTMRAQTEAMRGFAYEAAAYLDIAKRHPDADARQAAQARVDLLIPVVKAWCSDSGVEVASLGIQIHGGMGYIEETGAAQHYRDARSCDGRRGRAATRSSGDRPAGNRRPGGRRYPRASQGGRPGQDRRARQRSSADAADLARQQGRIRQDGANADRQVEAAFDHVDDPVVQRQRDPKLGIGREKPRQHRRDDGLAE